MSVVPVFVIVLPMREKRALDLRKGSRNMSKALLVIDMQEAYVGSGARRILNTTSCVA